ncbi:MAG TPA: arylsulfatase [Verrucomicrobiae bacterium]|jgi:arylsulfatase A-like enzyme
MNVRLLILLVLASLQVRAASTANAKPNIIVILSDDYGWGSVGCYGAAGVKTPNLVRLAREGRRFTHAYAPGSVCSPTRYGMMTGRYYWRTSIKDGEVLPGNAPLHIETNRLTLASLCKSQGYTTAAFGKWHLGLGTEPKRTDWSTPLKPGPLAVGFDHFYGLAANPWNGPHSFIENEQVLGKVPGQVVAITGNREGATTTGILKQFEVDYIMESLTGKVTDWIEQNRAAPFFVYFAPNAVHEPVAPNPMFTGSPYGKYGDFIHELDWSVGQVLATLDKLKLTDNTLIIFTSDNGGVVNRNNEHAAKAMDAGLAINGPLRGGKHDIWEGGFREPFLVRWPGKVPAGTVSDQVLCLTDVLATLAAVLNTPLPKGNAEDSFNALRAFTEARPGAPIRDHVILQAADGVYAVRAGDWKLIERKDPPKIEARNKKKAAQSEKKKKAAPKQDELFNVVTDVAEAKDAASSNADRAAQMKKLLVEARDRGFTRPGAK